MLAGKIGYFRRTFTPRSLSGLVLWLDATDATTYTTAAGVSAWNDKSGNGNNFTQSTGNNQPSVSTINGKTAFLFDGVNDQMNVASAILTGSASSPFTVFVVTQSVNTETGYIAAWNNAGAFGAGIYANATPVYTLADGTSQPRATSETRGNNVAEVVSVTYTNPNTQLFQINGVTGGSQGGLDYSFAASTGVFTLGNRFGGGSTATYFSGRLGAVICYTRALSAAERQQVTQYLGGLYGVSVA